MDRPNAAQQDLEAITAGGPLALLARVTGAAIDRPFSFLAGALAVTAVSVYLASGLEIRSSFEELLPEDVPSVARVKELIRRVGGDGTVLVNVESKRGPEGLAAAKELAPKLAADYLALGPSVIRSIEWNVDPVERWYTEHWPLFVPLSELEKAQKTIKDEVSRVKRKANPLLRLGGIEDEEPEPARTSTASPWLDESRLLPRQEVEKRFERYDDGFLVHPDKSSLVLVVRPAGTSLGVAEARLLVDRMREVAERHRTFLDAHQLRVGFAGSFPMFIAEYESIINEVASTALLCVGLVLLSLFAFFRDVRSSIALAISVLVGVAVTFGLTRLTIGYLNTQTAFLGSIVVGNGINYGLIYLSRVVQLRRAAVPLRPACVSGAVTAARATLLASAASSVAFGTLIIAANRGFRHFGFIGGIGMLLCWFFTFLLVPALLSIAERIRAVRPAATPDPEYPAVPTWVRRVFASPPLLIGASTALAVVCAGLFIAALPNGMERNLNNLTNELKGQEELLRDHDRAQSSLGKSIAGSIALLPSREDADRFCKAVLERRSKEPRFDRVVEGCDTISIVVPSEQEAKLAIIRDIGKRVSDAVLDRLPAKQAERLRSVREELRKQAPVTVEDAPATLIDRFRERDGSVGRLAVVTARPAAQLELAPNLAAFVEAVRNVPVGGELYDATGENVIFADLLENIEREGPIATLISFAGVCLLVALFFRRARSTFEVLTPLIAGVMMMGGIAALLDLKINFFNFIVFPITFGIAADYGANVVGRIRERGGDVLGALVEVGPAVMLCSWTTIIGYGTLLFALNRALVSFGWYAIIGEITTLVTAMVMLPAMMLRGRRASS